MKSKVKIKNPVLMQKNDLELIAHFIISKVIRGKRYSINIKFSLFKR